MSLLDAHIPQLIASHTAFAAKAGLMRHTIGQAEQQAMSAQAFHQGESAAALVGSVAPVSGGVVSPQARLVSVAGLAALPAVGAAAGAPAALVGSVAPVSGGVVSPQARLVSAVEPAPASTSVSVLASDRGAGALGFVGTAGKESVGQPAGLTVLADEFGDGAPVPMLPGSWGPDLVGVAGDGGLVSV
ncbi:PPE family protein [Mycobacterium tuberculosis]|nr:PPE family protein [Mycobacterium tuberculosis]